MTILPLTTMVGLTRTPVHVVLHNVAYFRESTAVNRPGTYVVFSEAANAPALFVEETMQDITSFANGGIND